MFVAGEASGDIHGAALIKEILKRSPNAELFGFGGEKMREAGMRVDVDLIKELRAMMGFLRILLAVRRIFRYLNIAEELLKKERPDALVLIDYPGFNLRLAARAKALGIPVIYYIAPQIWAWNYRRIHAIRRNISLMLVILRFEKDLFEKEGVPVKYVGHPIMDVPRPDAVAIRKEVLRRLVDQYGPQTAPGGTVLVGIVPGSRENEIQRLTGTLLEVARNIHNFMPNTRFVIPLASTISMDTVRPYLETARDLPIVVTTDLPTRGLYAVLDFALCKSGTSTLEMAVEGTPMVIVYKCSIINELIVRIFARIRWAGLPNIICNKEVVPEILGHSCTAKNITDAAKDLLQSPDTLQDIKAKFEQLRNNMGETNASANAAEAILEFLNNG